MNPVNSSAYWEDRFSTKDWEASGGQAQSTFFAEVALQLMPDFLKADLTNNQWRFLDIGCAQGSGTAYLAKHFPSCHFVGQEGNCLAR